MIAWETHTKQREGKQHFHLDALLWYDDGKGRNDSRKGQRKMETINHPMFIFS
jgi:hypothetical protein